MTTEWVIRACAMVSNVFWCKIHINRVYSTPPMIQFERCIQLGLHHFFFACDSIANEPVLLIKLQCVQNFVFLFHLLFLLLLCFIWIGLQQIHFTWALHVPSCLDNISRGEDDARDGEKKIALDKEFFFSVRTSLSQPVIIFRFLHLIYTANVPCYGTCKMLSSQVVSQWIIAHQFTLFGSKHT